jgi:hypothetical protein
MPVSSDEFSVYIPLLAFEISGMVEMVAVAVAVVVVAVGRLSRPLKRCGKARGPLIFFEGQEEAKRVESEDMNKGCKEEEEEEVEEEEKEEKEDEDVDDDDDDDEPQVGQHVGNMDGPDKVPRGNGGVVSLMGSSPKVLSPRDILVVSLLLMSALPSMEGVKVWYRSRVAKLEQKKRGRKKKKKKNPNICPELLLVLLFTRYDPTGPALHPCPAF